MRAILKYIAALALVMPITLTSSFAQKYERVDVALENSEVSFVGDDSFITRRYTLDPLPGRGLIWMEYLNFRGGSVFFMETLPDFIFSANREESEELIKSFNQGRKPIPDFDVKASAADIEKADNGYAEYYFLVKENDTGSCGSAKQYPGDRNTNSAYLSKGTMSVHISVCWRKSRGSAVELERFIHDVMTRIRFDEGALNKAKAARRNN